MMNTSRKMIYFMNVYFTDRVISFLPSVLKLKEGEIAISEALSAL